MEQKLEDIGNVTSYVVRGAKIRCSLGSSTDVLNLPISHGVYIQEKAQLSVEDRVSGVNIISFGTCKKIGVCVPSIPCKWINISDTSMLIEEKEALLLDSTIGCTVGGIIKIKDDGQVG
jgi:hypothetical protein